jgi:Trypsin-like peptidase domain
MFVHAIEQIENFTRPVQIISRLYGHNEISAGAGTLFFVNELGVAITCRHVAEVIIQAENVNNNYRDFKAKRYTISNQANYATELKRLEQDYNITTGAVIGQKTLFPQSFDTINEIEITMSSKHDLAIVRFKGYNQKLYKGFAHFLSDDTLAKRGRYLCRLGYPFTEFTNYRYDADIDDIVWTDEGRKDTPSFPIDGIITRYLTDAEGLSGLEISTPGLRGQSGGPLFDTHGRIYGIQSSTRHLHLGFDRINEEIMHENERMKVSNHPFLHVGQCVHVKVIKAFLKEHNIKFYEQ